MSHYSRYIKALKSSQVSYITLIELLDEYETVSKSIREDVLENSGGISITYQNGVRRTASIVIDNSLNKYDIDINKLWIYQKIKISTGVEYFTDSGEVETFLVPQGTFYITNPQDAYNPSNKTISFECIDKWARLNGQLGGTLQGTYSFPKNYTDKDGKKQTYEYSMFDIIRLLLSTPVKQDYRVIAYKTKILGIEAIDEEINNFLNDSGIDIHSIKYKEAIIITESSPLRGYYSTVNANPRITPKWELFYVDSERKIDNLEPILNNWFLTNDSMGNKRVLLPYSLTKDVGSSMADIIIELAGIMGGLVYYNREGRFVLEPTQDDSNFFRDEDKEVVWSFDENSKDGLLYNIEESYNWESIYNEIVAKGTITGLGSYTVIVQNIDPSSPVCVDKIGVKTKVYSDMGIYDYKSLIDVSKGIDENKAKDMVKNNLLDRAKYFLKLNTMPHSRINIECACIPHLDVGQIISVTKKGITKKYLINNINLPLDPTESMSIEASAVFDVRDIKVF